MASAVERIAPRRQIEIAEFAEHIAITRFHGERVQPEEIAAQESIAFRYSSFPEDFDGILLCEQKKFFIICNERRSARGTPRSRFTFAHELGHFFLDEHRLPLSSGKIPAHFSLAEFVSDQPIEAEADLFAANLLMPTKSFRLQAANLNPGIDLICTLASTFGTSVTSTAYRALELDVFPAPCAIFRWSAGGQLTSRRISPTTFSMCAGYRSMIDSPPTGSRTEYSLIHTGSGITKGVSDCSQWFPATLPGSKRNVLLQEEVMPLGQFGWVSLVFRSL
ncbi:MAG: ImmA/IrrE family metallo-endopeptidase [Nibricoccus sp.]